MTETKNNFDIEIKSLKEQWSKEVEKRDYEQKEKKADFKKSEKEKKKNISTSWL